MRIRNKRGFTLAELLVVVAILAVLVAISVPVFTSSLERSREAVDLSNLRSAYAEAVAKHIEDASNPASVKIENVKLHSTGAFDHVNSEELPFDLPASTSVSKGAYDVTFDFSSSRPSATLAAHSVS